MSAGCSVVAPNFSAIPETLSNFGIMYNWHEDVNKHANTFANALNAAFDIHWEENVQNKLKFQAMYVNNFYNWDLRATQWTGFLQSLGG
jgi:glycosyltransferase involved in cell wall biosynthesis